MQNNINSMRAFALVPIAAIFLRVLGLQTTLRVAKRAVRGHLPNDQTVRTYITWTERAGRYVPGGSCLAQSVALVWLLRGRGMDADVRVGVTNTRAFEAHAWVECDGKELTPSKGAEAIRNSRQFTGEI
jgi:hypothetical protein